MVGLLLTRDPFLLFLSGILLFSVMCATESGEVGGGEQTWDFTKQIVPLLIYGVLIAGFLLGRSGSEELISSEWTTRAVGGNGFLSTAFASVVGAFTYFATLTEIPILQGLIIGPLPNMLGNKSVIGFKKMVVFVSLVILMSSTCGLAYGNFF